MYTLRKVLFAAAALALFAAGCPAGQDEKIIAREDAVEVMLLRQPSVQQDLRVTPAEARKIDEFATRQWRKVREVMKESGEKERDRRIEAMARENDRFVKDILKPEQRRRLNQIAMQVAGLLWVLRSDVASELKLTDEQKRRIRTAHKEAEREAHEALRSGGERGVAEEKLRELRRADHERLMSVLTETQRARWRELAGPKFSGRLEFGPRGSK